MAHPPHTHTANKLGHLQAAERDNTHHPPPKKNGDCNVRTVREFLISKGKARIVINQPSCLCVYIHVHKTRESNRGESWSGRVFSVLVFHFCLDVVTVVQKKMK
jgi:hypothetical protein